MTVADREAPGAPPARRGGSRPVARSGPLVDRVERADAGETDAIARADVAIRTVLETFAGHRRMARLLFVDAFGAGRVFHAEIDVLHRRFSRLIAGYLGAAVDAGTIPSRDTRIAGEAWFGALNEIVARWLLDPEPTPLLDAYPTLRLLLLRSVGVPEPRIADIRRAAPEAIR